MLAVGIILILYGIAKFNSPGGMYNAHWGGMVYAPFVIFAGVIVVVGAFVQKDDAAALKAGDKPVEFPHETIRKAWRG